MDNARPYYVVRESGDIFGTYPDIGAARHLLDILECVYRDQGATTNVERSTVDRLVITGDRIIGGTFEIVPAPAS